MADLNKHAFWCCKSAVYFEVGVEGSKGETYRVSFGAHNPGEYGANWGCTCKCFKFRGTCKHVAVAKVHRCGWNQFTDGGEPAVDENGTHRCPECGGEVTAMNWGV